MSLKSFHLVLISSSLGLFAFTAGWGWRELQAGPDGLGTAAASVAGFACAAAYLAWFVRKYRGLR